MLLAQPNLRFLIFEAAHNHRTLYGQIQNSGATLFGLDRDPLRLRITRIDSFAAMDRFHDLIAVRIAPGISVPVHVDPRKFGPYLAALNTGPNTDEGNPS